MVGLAGIGALGRGNVRNVELKPQTFIHAQMACDQSAGVNIASDFH